MQLGRGCDNPYFKEDRKRKQWGDSDAKDPPNVRRDLDGSTHFFKDRNGFHGKMRELILRTTRSEYVKDVMAPNMVLDKKRYWDMITDASTSPARRKDFPGIRQVWSLRVCRDPEVLWRFFYFKWSAKKPKLMSLIRFDENFVGRMTKLTAQSANLPFTSIEGRYWLVEGLQRHLTRRVVAQKRDGAASN
jgi:hypothetical protein